MTMFQDADPEDAWAAGDSTTEQILVIKLMLVYIRNHDSDLTPAERIRRLDYVLDSVEFIGARLRNALQTLIGDN